MNASLDDELESLLLLLSKLIFVDKLELGTESGVARDILSQSLDLGNSRFIQVFLL